MRPLPGESLPAGVAGRLREAGLDPGYVARVAAVALAEDLALGEFADGVHPGGADLTTEATIPAAARASADVVARADGVVAGLPVAEAVFWLAARQDAGHPGGNRGAEDQDAEEQDAGHPGGNRGAEDQDAEGQDAEDQDAEGQDAEGQDAEGQDAEDQDAEDQDAEDQDAARRDEGAGTGSGDAAPPFGCKYHAADGERVNRGQVLLTVTGPVRTLLTAERTALNLLCHLSGVATLTRRWVDEIAGTGAAIRDTRKTLPGLRALQKYAVRCGGGRNHRMSLSDAVLIKDNHVAAAGSITAALAGVSRVAPHIRDDPARMEVECDTLDQVREAAAAGARLILLDNFAVADMAKAVAMVELAAGQGPRPLLEASGGLTLAGARDVAATGVDYLSVGALTHSAPALDIALDLALAAPDRPVERHAADD